MLKHMSPAVGESLVYMLRKKMMQGLPQRLISGSEHGTDSAGCLEAGIAPDHGMSQDSHGSVVISSKLSKISGRAVTNTLMQSNLSSAMSDQGPCGAHTR